MTWWRPCDQSLRRSQSLCCRWTQAKIAVALGVSRATVENWVDISNDKSVKANIDARLSVNAEAKSVIIEQSAEGVAQKQLAADFGISQQRVSQIITTAAAETVTRDLESLLRQLTIFQSIYQSSKSGK